jgi:hypothetical protein
MKKPSDFIFCIVEGKGNFYACINSKQIWEEEQCQDDNLDVRGFGDVWNLIEQSGLILWDASEGKYECKSSVSEHITASEVKQILSEIGLVYDNEFYDFISEYFH